MEFYWWSNSINTGKSKPNLLNEAKVPTSKVSQVEAKKESKGSQVEVETETETETKTEIETVKQSFMRRGY